MMDHDITFGEWLRRRRRELDLTRQELAHRVGCGVTTLRKIEAGERRPSKELAMLLANCLEIGPEEYDRFITFARTEPYPDRPPPPSPAVRSPNASSAPVVMTPLPPFLTQDTSLVEPPPVFAARERELTELETALMTARLGKGQILFVIGGAGRGKTMLVQEFAQRAQAADPELLVVSGYCNAHTGLGDPYLPFREALTMLTGDVEAKSAAGLITSAHARRLWELMPLTVPMLVKQAPDLIGTFVSAGPLLERAATFTPSNAPWFKQLMTMTAREPSAGLEQKQILAQYTALLKTVVVQRSLLFILEDLHWVDASSNALLFYLSREVGNDRILIIGSYRPDEIALSRGEVRHPLADTMGELKRRHGDIWLDLGDLAPAEGQHFVAAYLDTQPNRLGRAFREALFRQTEGHALFTAELLREMQERGDLRQDEAGYWVEGQAIDWQTLPAKVEGVIEQRISRLSADLQAILTVASIEGETFTAEVVARVQQLNERGLVQQLSRELDKQHRLVTAQALDRVGQQRLSFYRFRHYLFQHYLYHNLDETERAYLHEAVGLELEALYGEQTELVAVQLAHHFEQAGLTEKAVRYLRQAGDQARRVAAPHEAIRFYRDALEHWPDEDQAGRAETLRKLGECLWLTGQFQEALATYEAGQALFEQLGDRVQAGAVQRLMGRLYWEQGGDRARALHHYHQALALLEQEPESIELAHALSAIAQMHMAASYNDEAIAWGGRALALAERLGAEEVMIHALNSIGSAYMYSYQDSERGLAMLQDSLRRASKMELPHDVCRAYSNMGDGLSYMCRYAEARATFEEGLIYATRVHAIWFVGFALVRLGELDWLGGQWAAALARRQRLLEWMESLPTPTVPRVWASTLLGWMHNDLGQPQAARQVLEAELPGARGRGEAETTVPHLGQLARALASLGREVETGALVQEFLAVIDRTPDAQSASTLPLIFACQWFAAHPAAGGLPAAQACLRWLEQAHRQIGSLETEAAYHEGQGIIALAEENPTQAVESFDSAVAGWQGLDRPYDQLRALSGLGQALKQLGDLQQAQTIINEALHWVEMLAAQLDDPTLKASFLSSPLVQGIRAHPARGGLIQGWP